MCSGDDVALNILELRLRLFHGELLVSARLLKHLPARGDTTKGAARCHGFDIGIEELLRCLEIMRRNSLDELTCAGEPHRRKAKPPSTRSSSPRPSLHSRYASFPPPPSGPLGHGPRSSA